MTSSTNLVSNYFYILNDFALDITINKRFTMKEME